MAAHEDQLEPLVGKVGFVHVVLLRLGQVEQLGLLGEGAVAADAVERAAAGRSRQPGAGVVRRAVARPALRRDRESPLGCLLGEVEVAKVADEGRQDALPAAARRQPLLRATMQTAVARIRVTFTSVAAHDGRT
jgi:hypothetical protein